jgi:hypothetical protein
MRRVLIIALSALALGAGVLAAPGVVGAQQQLPGLNPQRDCQTVRTCRFARNGVFRGCLSSYTCRTCRLVKTRCTLAGRSNCRELVCSWGG